MQFFGFRVLIKRIKAIRFMMADKTVKWTKKAIIIAGIVYLFLPVDIIPPVIFHKTGTLLYDLQLIFRNSYSVS